MSLLVPCLTFHAVLQQNVELALDVYHRAKLDPGTATRGVILERSDIAVNGLLSDKFDSLLSGMHRGSGKPVVIKILLCHTANQLKNRTSELMVVEKEGLLPRSDDDEVRHC